MKTFNTGYQDLLKTPELGKISASSQCCASGTRIAMPLGREKVLSVNDGKPVDVNAFNKIRLLHATTRR